MNGHDAFEEEMLFRTLTDGDTERLLQGRAPEGSEFVEVAEFARAVRQNLPTRPDGASAMVRQLAEAARTASPQGAIQTTPVAVPARARRFRLQSPRLIAVARLAAIVAVVPLLFAGLAAAGVSVPEPARDAFEVVGVNLPNQSADDGQEAERSGGAAGGAGDEGGEKRPEASEQSAAKRKGEDGAADKRGHGVGKANPARAGGRANGEQGRGRALGKRGLAPGQVVPPGQIKKGEGGNKVQGDKSVGKTNATSAAKNPMPSTGQGNGEASGKGTSNSGGGAASKPTKVPKG